MIFRHNDLGHLEALLRAAPADAPKLIAFEVGVFDGRRYRAARCHLRSGGALRRDDISR